MKKKILCGMAGAFAFLAAGLFAESLTLTSPKAAPKASSAAVRAADAPQAPVYLLRAQQIEVFAQALSRLKEIAAAQKDAGTRDFPEVRLELFDDLSYELVLSAMAQDALGNFVISGALKGVPFSTALIVVDAQNRLVANLKDPQTRRILRIVCDLGGKTQRVEELDFDKMPNLPDAPERIRPDASAAPARPR